MFELGFGKKKFLIVDSKMSPFDVLLMTKLILKPINRHNFQLMEKVNLPTVEDKL